MSLLRGPRQQRGSRQERLIQLLARWPRRVQNGSTIYSFLLHSLSVSSNCRKISISVSVTHRGFLCSLYAIETVCSFFLFLPQKPSPISYPLILRSPRNKPSTSSTSRSHRPITHVTDQVGDFPFWSRKVLNPLRKKHLSFPCSHRLFC